MLSRKYIKLILGKVSLQCSMLILQWPSFKETQLHTGIDKNIIYR